MITPGIEIALATAAGRADVGGYANRFAPTHTSGGEANAQIAAFRDDLDPGSYCDVVAGWLDRGATMVGGCCGMEPQHIAALAELVESRE